MTKGDIITKIKNELSTTIVKIGKWPGVFDSYNGEKPNYWNIADNIEQAYKGNSALLFGRKL